MKPARAELDVAHRDVKPDNEIEIRLSGTPDPRRVPRFVEILIEILDNKVTPGKGPRS